MEQILVQDIMLVPASTDEGFFVTPDTTVDEAARLLRKHKIDRLLVISAGGNVIGQVTASAVARSMFEINSQIQPPASVPPLPLSGMLIK